METKVLVSQESLENTLKLIHTREWPLEYMVPLGKVALEFGQALGRIADENQGTNKD